MCVQRVLITLPWPCSLLANDDDHLAYELRPRNMTHHGAPSSCRQLAADGIEATGGPAAHVGAEPAAAQRSKAGKKSKGGKKDEKKQKKAKVVKGKSKKASDDAAAEL